jgi:aldehyde:ferredoxin oxidoreductase
MYTNRVLRVDMSNKKTIVETIDENICRKYVGGIGIGAYILCREVPVGTKWNDPQNRLIFGAGPLNATTVAGSGSICVVTKGALTNGATSTQANGYFGAFLRLSGFETIVVEGSSDEWMYLYISNGAVELKSAKHLVGKDTLETERQIREDFGKKRKELSVYAIGPAGENGVRFSAIVGDDGHVAAHNGVGAVMGAKKLKAIAIERGKGTITAHDQKGLSALNKMLLDRTKTERPDLYLKGTSYLLGMYVDKALLPVKNLTTNVFKNHEKLTGDYYRSTFTMEPRPCWRCPLKHVHNITVTEGPYKGYSADEPEYELFAGFGPQIGQTDPGAVVMLADTVDRLGMDGNEASWLIGFVMECYDKGVLTKSDTGGIEITWGNVEAVREILLKIARREGIGDILAEGVMRAAEKIGGEALNMAVYVKKGHAPRGHDHRMRWIEMFDTATSDCGTLAVGPQAVKDPFSPEDIVNALTKKRVRSFIDSLVICAFPSNSTATDKIGPIVEMLNAATGWDYTESEAKTTTLRIDNLLRAFNIRHGLTSDLEDVSPRYSSAQKDGPIKAKSIRPYWNDMLSRYYQIMGWDKKSGKPLPETLKALGLEEIVDDLWQMQD